MAVIFRLQCVLLLLLLCSPAGMSQALSSTNAPDTLSRSRVWLVAGGGTLAYAGGMSLLYQAWYAKQPQSKFHTFDDHAEWLQVDKIGHVFSTYTESLLAYKALRWAGVKEHKAAWLGLGSALVFQTTIEVFDGFSDKWGFSWSDMLANAIGGGAFIAQQQLWQEQKIRFKISSDFRSYSRAPIIALNDPHISDDLHRRTAYLFGTHPAALLLKDYNAQTNWLSINPASLMCDPPSWLPGWLNLGLGYSAENMYGGFANEWSHMQGQFSLSKTDFPRYRQFILSPDIDFSRLRIKSPFWKTFFTVLNIVKVPAPGLEYNSLGKFKWHWIYF